MFKTFPQSFFERDPVSVAKDILGHFLVRRVQDSFLVGKIVEVEAYLDESDPASHAAAGMTERSKIFWGPGGRAYVFVIYGIHHCLNVITMPKGEPGCVLIRAVEPVIGIEIMRRNRGGRDGVELTNGPGKLCSAFDIDLSFNNMDLTDLKSTLFIARNLEIHEGSFEIGVTPRVGISKGTERMLRFFIQGNPYVSRAYFSKKK